MDKTIPVVNLADLIMRLWCHLSRSRQRQFILLLCLMLVSAFAEVVSLAAVLPFLGILVAPDRLFSRPFVADMVKALGITSADELVLPLTVLFAVAALIAGAVRIILLWFSTRLAFAAGADLSIEIYLRTLYQPYRVHLARNSSEVISGISNKVVGVVGVLLSYMTLISSTLLLIVIMVALITIDPMVASVSAVGFGSSYALITWLYRKRLRRNSHRIAHEQTQVIKALQEGLGGIRDVLLDGTQSVYTNIYRQADQPLRRAQGDNYVIGQSPRYVMEALGMVLIAGLAYALSRQVGGVANALPVLGVLALGAQRLLPALQQSYSAWVSIAGSQVSLADTIALLEQPLPAEYLEPPPEKLLLQNNIRFDSVQFRYNSEDPWVLDGLNLKIPKGARVGFVGSTGSGKSTLLDMLMGLLLPTEGQMLIDGQPIKGNRLRAWQRSIAHVPQSIYMADTTLAENIAFGVPLEKIDFDLVQQVVLV